MASMAAVPTFNLHPEVFHHHHRRRRSLLAATNNQRSSSAEGRGSISTRPAAVRLLPLWSRHSTSLSTRATHSTGGASEYQGYDGDSCGDSPATSSDRNSSIIGRPKSGDGYVGLFIRMLGLDNDPLDREHAVDTLWKYAQGGKDCVDCIMQFPGCINLVVNLLRSDSCSTCEAAAGLLRTVSSVNLYRTSVAESGAMEEIAGLLVRPSLTPEVKEQSICTLWNLSIDDELRAKIAKSEILPTLIKFLDDEEMKVKEATVGVLANLALSHCNHSIMVEAGAIPKLAELYKSDTEGPKIARKLAKNALLELCKEEYNKILIIEEDLILVPVVGSAAYKSFRPVSYSWPSLPDGTEIQKTSTSSRYGASELLIGLNMREKSSLEEAKMNAVVGRSRQQFLARIGAIEMEEGEISQAESSLDERQTLLPLVDGVARLSLILDLEDTSAICRAARAIGDASISKYIRISFKEAGSVKKLAQLLDHKDESVRESAAYALERLSVSYEVCQVIEAGNLFYPLFNFVKRTNASESLKEKAISILARIFNPGKIMKAELNDKLINRSEKSAVDQVDKNLDPLALPEVIDRDKVVDSRIICCLIEIMKTSSPNLQKKVASILEYLANFEVHRTSITSGGVDNAVLTVLQQRCLDVMEDDYEPEQHAFEAEEAGLAVAAVSRLLTKLLTFEQFHHQTDLAPFINSLRRILRSSIPIHAKDWVAACLVKIELLIGSVKDSEYLIDMEVTLYETIPRLVKQMKISFSLESRVAAVIDLNNIISKGMIECTRAIASAGGIFPLVELIDQVDDSALEAGLAILYNLSMDSENHAAIISAGAVPVLRRIVLSERPQWARALDVLRTLPT